MAQMQWLGTIPKEDKWSYLADAIKGGTKSYMEGKEKAQNQKIKTDEISYNKKKDLANMMLKIAGTLPPGKADEFLAGVPGLQDTFGELGMTLPKGMGKTSAKINKAGAMLDTKQTLFMGMPRNMSGNRDKVISQIALELGDADWIDNYPELATKLNKGWPDPAAAAVSDEGHTLATGLGENTAKADPKGEVYNEDSANRNKIGKALMDEAESLLKEKGIPVTQEAVMEVVKQLVGIKYGGE